MGQGRLKFLGWALGVMFSVIGVTWSVSWVFSHTYDQIQDNSGKIKAIDELTQNVMILTNQVKSLNILPDKVSNLSQKVAVIEQQNKYIRQDIKELSHKVSQLASDKVAGGRNSDETVFLARDKH